MCRLAGLFHTESIELLIHQFDSDIVTIDYRACGFTVMKGASILLLTKLIQFRTICLMIPALRIKCRM